MVIFEFLEIIRFPANALMVLNFVILIYSVIKKSVRILEAIELVVFSAVFPFVLVSYLPKPPGVHPLDWAFEMLSRVELGTMIAASIFLVVRLLMLQSQKRE